MERLLFDVPPVSNYARPEGRSTSEIVERLAGAEIDYFIHDIHSPFLPSSDGIHKDMLFLAARYFLMESHDTPCLTDSNAPTVTPVKAHCHVGACLLAQAQNSLYAREQLYVLFHANLLSKKGEEFSFFPPYLLRLLFDGFLCRLMLARRLCRLLDRLVLLVLLDFLLVLRLRRVLVTTMGAVRFDVLPRHLHTIEAIRAFQQLIKRRRERQGLLRAVRTDNRRCPAADAYRDALACP